MPRLPFPAVRCLCLGLVLLGGPLSAAEGGDVAALPVTALPTGATSTYTVRAGDTAYSVARLAGTDVATLLALNGLAAPDLSAGQVLKLPGKPGWGGPARSAATAPGTATGTVPRTHTVQAGQTLYSVARLYGLKPGDLQDFNRLSSPDLRPGQVLLLPETAAAALPFGPPAPVVVASAPAPVARPAALPGPLPQARHTVQPGQTLYAIARLYSLRPADLIALNRLPTGDLHAGQVLLLPAGTVAQPPAALPATSPPASAVPAGTLLTPGVPLPTAPSPNAPGSDLPPTPDQAGEAAPAGDWRSVALSLMGVPYQYGGQTRGGTDCSGLVLQVFGPLGLKLPRQSALQAQTGTLVQPGDLQAGDLLFFDTEGRGTVTHVGIYLGEYGGRPDAFINANSYNGQVAVNQLSDRYFAQRYLWARRVLGVLAQGN